MRLPIHNLIAYGIFVAPSLLAVTTAHAAVVNLKFQAYIQSFNTTTPGSSSSPKNLFGHKTGDKMEIRLSYDSTQPQDTNPIINQPWYGETTFGLGQSYKIEFDIGGKVYSARQGRTYYSNNAPTYAYNDPQRVGSPVAYSDGFTTYGNLEKAAIPASWGKADKAEFFLQFNENTEAGDPLPTLLKSTKLPEKSSDLKVTTAGEHYGWLTFTDLESTLDPFGFPVLAKRSSLSFGVLPQTVLGPGSSGRSISKALRETGGSPDAGYSWTLSDEKLQFDVRIGLVGDIARVDTFVPLWRSGIVEDWNKFKIERDGIAIPIVFNPIFNVGEDGADVAVNVIDKPGRSNAIEWHTSIDPLKVIFSGAFTQDAHSKKMASHEFGHILGLWDEYKSSRGTDPLGDPNKLCDDRLPYLNQLANKLLGKGEYCWGLMAANEDVQERYLVDILRNANEGFLRDYSLLFSPTKPVNNGPGPWSEEDYFLDS